MNNKRLPSILLCPLKVIATAHVPKPSCKISLRFIISWVLNFFLVVLLGNLGCAEFAISVSVAYDHKLILAGNCGEVGRDGNVSVADIEWLLKSVEFLEINGFDVRNTFNGTEGTLKGNLAIGFYPCFFQLNELRIIRESNTIHASPNPYCWRLPPDEARRISRLRNEFAREPNVNVGGIAVRLTSRENITQSENAAVMSGVRAIGNSSRVRRWSRYLFGLFSLFTFGAAVMLGWLIWEASKRRKQRQPTEG